MASQAQCPNCGGYKVSSTSRFVNPKTRQEISGGGLGCFLSIVVTIVVLVGCWLIGHYFFINEGNSPIVIIALFGIPLVAGLAVLQLFSSKRSEAIAKAITVYNSSCSLCGYSWVWETGKPYPKVQLRPDLIQKGAKKLEEEEAEAAAARAAWYWQQQQNKKKR